MKKLLYIAGATCLMLSMSLTSCNKGGEENKNESKPAEATAKVIDQFTDSTMFVSDATENGSIAVLLVEGENVNVAVLPKDSETPEEFGEMKFEKTDNGITFTNGQMVGLIQEDNVLTFTDEAKNVIKYPNLKKTDKDKAPIAKVEQTKKEGE